MAKPNTNPFHIAVLIVAGIVLVCCAFSETHMGIGMSSKEQEDRLRNVGPCMAVRYGYEAHMGYDYLPEKAHFLVDGADAVLKYTLSSDYLERKRVCLDADGNVGNCEMLCMRTEQPVKYFFHEGYKHLTWVQCKLNRPI